jgi:ATP-dependent helicase HrpA
MSPASRHTGRLVDDLDQTRRELAARIPALMVRDTHDLGRRLDRVRHTTDADELVTLATAVEEAERKVEQRRAGAPVPTYPEGLPITERAGELVQVIRDHQVVIVAGETGSGKSTQLPKLCIEAGRGVRGVVGHTQPRRLAARTIAERVASELGGDVGDVVGYTVRFTDRISDKTLVRVMTDGILLAEIQRDRLLRRYDTLIIDEAHERSLNIDFILGYLKQLLPRRPDLKVIVTSATIDTERFSEHFGGAPVVEVSGRTYPVELRYQPVGEDPDDDRDQTQAICDAVVELGREDPGDVLVFLSGEREIRDTADALRRMELRNTEVLPLYARLSAADQHRVFAPHTGRRVVLATNVAETSLTVPGIRYVVDPGTARISRYSRRTKVQRLPIEAVSQASANQRAGRCGRVAPGICVRLYSEEDFEARPAFTEPEVLRTNLASVILQMTAIGLGDVAAFPFVEPPDARSIRDGIDLLTELGALDPDSQKDRPRLTPVGRSLSRLPLDPRLGRMILDADRNGCVAEVMVIAAALSIQDPRERPTGKEQAAAELHARFRRDDSDFLSFLALWDHLKAEQQARGSSQFRKMCKAEHLNHLRVREWQDVHGQLRIVVRSLGIRANAQEGTPDAIHRSLLAGLLSQIGMRDGEKSEFLGARQARFAIAPGSTLFKKPPKWVMVAELVETNRLWGRVAARIQPEWAEELGAHLTKASHGEPWWDGKRANAMCNERVTLYGLPVVAARKVPFGRVDPEGARDMFIHHALVEGDWKTHHPFLEANRKLVEEIRDLEDRARRRDILVGNDALFALYDERIGERVTSARHFDSWWKKARRRDPDLLTFTIDDLVDPAAGDVSADAFPEHWVQGPHQLDLHYEFDPSSELDGVTVDIPLPLLDAIEPVGFDWQVPGLREELVTALIRSLPKAVRRHVSPAADHARAFLDRAGPADGPLLDVLTRELRRMAGEPIPPGSWQLDRVPDHLRITFRIVSARGKPLAWSKDLVALRDHLRKKMAPALSGAAQTVERTGLTSWTIGTLERSIEVETNGYRSTVHPALVDEDGTVAVRTFPTRVEQHRAMWAGLRRLVLLDVRSPVAAVQRKLRNDTKLALAHAPYASVAEVVDDCLTAALDKILVDRGGIVWNEDDYRNLRTAAKDRLVDTAVQVATAAGRILAAAAEVERRLDRLTAPAVQPALTDIHTQVARLIHPGFVTAAGAERLADVERYLRAIGHRLDKLVEDPHRDRARMHRAQVVEEAVDRLRRVRAGREVDALRWMVEELRVSLFAESLGTAGPISEKRVLREVERLSSP